MQMNVNAVNIKFHRERTMQNKVSKTNHYHHGNLRQSLLDNAIDLIREKGFEKFSLRSLAARVGVSQTAIYRHFTDKNALFAELALQAFIEILEIAQQLLTGADTASAKVRNAVKAYLTFAIEQPEKYRLMFGSVIQNPEQFEELTALGLQAFEFLKGFIEEGQASGEFDAGSSMLIACSGWASLHGYASFLLDGLYTRINLEENIDDLLEQYICMLLKSVGAVEQVSPTA
jgi:AcrR family transcriptional regulator